MKVNTDNKKIQELIQLSNENPDLEIIPMVNYEVCGSDDFQYWKCEISKVSKELYMEKDVAEGCALVLGEYDIKDHLELYLDDHEVEEDVDSYYQKLFDKQKIKEAIFIWLDV